MKKNVLVLGVKGMVGRTVYDYLRSQHYEVFGTSRNKKDKGFFYLNTSSCDNDFKAIYKHLTGTTYVINCIGVLPGSDSTDLILVNSLFPHNLSKIAKLYRWKLIHISSDAVFGEKEKVVNESSPLSPDTEYGASKMLGECYESHELTIRTSFLGLNPVGKKGLLEWIRATKRSEITGFSNQTWSGCTTLQFAHFCERLIFYHEFSTFKKIATVIHFTPLHSTKYFVVKIFNKITNEERRLIKKRGKLITRNLYSNYFDFSKSNLYTTHTEKALKELLQFEKYYE